MPAITRHTSILILFEIAALIGTANCGRGSSSTPQSGAVGTSGGSSTPITVTGCVQSGELGGSVLRLSDHGTPGSGTSTAAAQPWLGTRAYRLISDSGDDLARLAGSWVDATGSIAGRAEPSGQTDQQQARNGERYLTLRASSLVPLGKPCPAQSTEGGGRRR
jgi:hypothetical protein